MLSQAEMLQLDSRTIRESFVGVMTTVDADQAPHSRCMGAALEEQGIRRLYTLTGRHTVKLENIARNPAVSWLFSAEGYERVVTLKGTAEVLDAPVIAQKAWDRLAQAARAYSMNALSDEDNLDFVVIETRVTHADLLYPEKGLVKPETVELPTEHA